MTLDFYKLGLLLVIGILMITFIDVFGSILSRKLNFKYHYLMAASFIVYGFIGYQGFQITTLTWSLLVVCLVGIYDGTIGWNLSIILKANFGDKEEHTNKLTLLSRVSGMILVSGILGLLGFTIATFVTN